jgi:circadian clock protein KaiB
MNPPSKEAGSPPTNDSSDEKRIVLRLYVSGDSENSHRALANLKAFIRENPEKPIMLEVIDLMVEPQRGAGDGIIVTPTLVKVEPSPGRRVVGDLKHTLTLRVALGVDDIKP